MEGKLWAGGSPGVGGGGRGMPPPPPIWAGLPRRPQALGRLRFIFGPPAHLDVLPYVWVFFLFRPKQNHMSRRVGGWVSAEGGSPPALPGHS